MVVFMNNRKSRYSLIISLNKDYSFMFIHEPIFFIDSMCVLLHMVIHDASTCHLLFVETLGTSSDTVAPFTILTINRRYT